MLKRTRRGSTPPRRHQRAPLGLSLLASGMGRYHQPIFNRWFIARTPPRVCIFARRLHDAMRRWVFLPRAGCVRVEKRLFEYVGRAISPLAAVQCKSQPLIYSCFSFKHASTDEIRFNGVKRTHQTFLYKRMTIFGVWNVWLVRVKVFNSSWLTLESWWKHQYLCHDSLQRDVITPTDCWQPKHVKVLYCVFKYVSLVLFNVFRFSDSVW